MLWIFEDHACIHKPFDALWIRSDNASFLKYAPLTFPFTKFLLVTPQYLPFLLSKRLLQNSCSQFSQVALKSRFRLSHLWGVRRRKLKRREVHMIEREYDDKSREDELTGESMTAGGRDLQHSHYGSWSSGWPQWHKSSRSLLACVRSKEIGWKLEGECLMATLKG
jgi:hypothetical protein